jgi:hypothetical protein
VIIKIILNLAHKRVLVDYHFRLQNLVLWLKQCILLHGLVQKSDYLLLNLKPNFASDRVYRLLVYLTLLRNRHDPNLVYRLV